MGHLFHLITISIVSLILCGGVHGNAELEALMEIKSSLDPQNTVLRSWTRNTDPCDGSFEGVICNEYHKVANISLQAKGLSGELSPALASLKCLSGLYLHYNSLSGEIPSKISILTELTELYLNVNNLSGNIPSEIGNMASLQVVQLCCNELSGKIPPEIGFLKRLNSLALQRNKLSGEIPASFGELNALKRLDLSSNNLSGVIPAKLARIPSMQVFDVKNNSLSGFVPSGFRRLKKGFEAENNPRLCGVGFSQLRPCTPFDNVRIDGNGSGPEGSSSSSPEENDPDSNLKPESANIHPCHDEHGCEKSTHFTRAAVISAVATLTVTMICAAVFVTIRFRRKKQKIGNVSDHASSVINSSENHAQVKEFRSKSSASPLVSLEYRTGWDELGSSRESLDEFRLNMEEIEAATNYFSEANLIGSSNRTKFSSSVYKGVLRDGSSVATRRIGITSCKSEESEFVEALDLLFSLRHPNLTRLRGFCCSRSRNECFLVYDFAQKGKLSRLLESQSLEWPKRVSILTGIAKGIDYLHRKEPSIVHQNISTEKVLIDAEFNAVISDSGLLRLLAEDVMFSALKTSAAMGYLAPEYVTTGRFTRKSDVYAFGIVIFQVVSGLAMLTSLMRSSAGSARLEGFVDVRLGEEFKESEAVELGRLALDCTQEVPEDRPSIEEVVQRLTKE